MYKKIDFNVALLHQDGNPQMRPKADRTKVRKQEDGQLRPDPIIDENGYVVQEPVPLCEILGNIVDNIYKGEDTIDHTTRLARGKLARKIVDTSASSLKNYQDEEITMLIDCLVKAQAAPSIVDQVNQLINGAGEKTSEAA